MAQNGRFALSLRVLIHLALASDTMSTSTEIAAALKTSPVMVRRTFSTLSKAGFIAQRKGPAGGAKLKVAAKSIGIGDIYKAALPWPSTGEKGIDAVLKRVGEDAIAAMNETSLGSIAKKTKNKQTPGADKKDKNG